MLRKSLFTILVAICLSMPVSLAWSSPDLSVIQGQDVFTVTDVLVDKTDQNAVTARKAAILEAKRSAFGRLARNLLSEEQFKEYELPEDAKISNFVRDFEIKDEKLSSNRYKANFTVRFNPEAAEFIEYGDNPFGGMFGSRPRVKTSKRVFGRERVILMVPYFKNFFGQEVLWEDPNPWRDEWQTLGGVMVSKDVSIIVPTGDLKDVSAGTPAAVWQGDYSLLEKLMANYHADEAMVTLASREGDKITIDVYGYYQGSFEYKVPVISSVSQGGFSSAVSEIVEDKELFEDKAPQPMMQDKTYVLEVTMFFDNPKEWLGARKRIVSVEPTPVLNILRLNRDSVQFNLKVESEDKFYDLLRELDKKRLNLIPANYQTSAVVDPGVEKRNYVLRLDY